MGRFHVHSVQKIWQERGGGEGVIEINPTIFEFSGKTCRNFVHRLLFC